MSTEEGESKSKELNVMFIETSAKAGFNIKVRFRFLQCLDAFALDALVRTSRYTVIHAAAVPQDRRGAAGDGDSLVGEAGGHGGREPEADLRPVQLAAAGGQWMRLLGTNSANSAHTRA